MAFHLEIEFSGLCLYVLDPDGTRVGVLMVDARERTHIENPSHADGEPAEPHVGYLGCDLADLGLKVPGGEDGGAPRYEFIHRFDREAVDFGDAFAEAPIDAGTLNFPAVDRFAPDLEPLPGLFGANPPEILLMRTLLTGGTLTSNQEQPLWRFSKRFNPEGEEYSGRFSSFATWTRRVESDYVTLRITSLSGETHAELTLRPANGGDKVRLKMSNLCRENPLEWDDLPIRTVQDKDVDFRWLYRLLQSREDSFNVLLQKELPGEEKGFPIPRMADLAGESGANDCMGTQVAASTR
jgi:hypothetical protein